MGCMVGVSRVPGEKGGEGGAVSGWLELGGALNSAAVSFEKAVKTQVPITI